MAYPNKLPSVGQLRLGSDAFEFFKAALMDYNINSELWPSWAVGDEIDNTPVYFVYNEFQYLGFPCSRGVFYSYIDTWTITPSTTQYTIERADNWFNLMGGQKLYEIAEPSSGWSIKAINDWAKIKLLEFTIFGDIANGGDLSKMSSVGSGIFHTVVPNFTRCDQSLLRYALVNFDDYGTCFSDNAKMPSPTNFVGNVANRTFDFTYAPGYNSPTYYYYTYKDGSVIPITTKPVLIDYRGELELGDLKVHTFPQGYLQESDPLLNNIAYPAYIINIFLEVMPENFGEYVVYASVSDYVSENLMLTVSLYVDGISELYSVSIPGGT